MTAYPQLDPQGDAYLQSVFDATAPIRKPAHAIQPGDRIRAPERDGGLLVVKTVGPSRYGGIRIYGLAPLSATPGAQLILITPTRNDEITLVP